MTLSIIEIWLFQYPIPYIVLIKVTYRRDRASEQKKNRLVLDYVLLCNTPFKNYTFSQLRSYTKISLTNSQLQISLTSSIPSIHVLNYKDLPMVTPIHNKLI